MNNRPSSLVILLSLLGAFVVVVTLFSLVSDSAFVVLVLVVVIMGSVEAEPAVFLLPPLFPEFPSVFVIDGATGAPTAGQFS